MDFLNEIGVQRWKLREQAIPNPVPAISARNNVIAQANESIVDSDITSPQLSETKSVEAAGQLDQELVHSSVQQVPTSTPAPETKYSWQKLVGMVEDKQHCPSCEPHNVLLGEGDVTADWLFVIDSPSKQDCQNSQIISGRSGQLFDAILSAIGETRESIYLSSVFKCPPSDDLSRGPQCGELLSHQIKLVMPKRIICLGEFASQSVLRANEALPALRESQQFYAQLKIPVFASYSIRELLDTPILKAQIWQDLKNALRV